MRGISVALGSFIFFLVAVSSFFVKEGLFFMAFPTALPGVKLVPGNHFSFKDQRQAGLVF